MVKNSQRKSAAMALDYPQWAKKNWGSRVHTVAVQSQSLFVGVTTDRWAIKVLSND